MVHRVLLYDGIDAATATFFMLTVGEKLMYRHELNVPMSQIMYKTKSYQNMNPLNADISGPWFCVCVFVFVVDVHAVWTKMQACGVGQNKVGQKI